MLVGRSVVPCAPALGIASRALAAKVRVLTYANRHGLIFEQLTAEPLDDRQSRSRWCDVARLQLLAGPNAIARWVKLHRANVTAISIYAFPLVMLVVIIFLSTRGRMLFSRAPPPVSWPTAATGASNNPRALMRSLLARAGGAADAQRPDPDASAAADTTVCSGIQLREERDARHAVARGALTASSAAVRVRSRSREWRANRADANPRARPAG